MEDVIAIEIGMPTLRTNQELVGNQEIETSLDWANELKEDASGT